MTKSNPAKTSGGWRITSEYISSLIGGNAGSDIRRDSHKVLLPRRWNPRWVREKDGQG